MVWRLCVLCLAAVLALLSRLAEAVGPVVRCEPCDSRALEQCKPLAAGCEEAVREPGCGCCLTCALTEGQACGVYTERCGSGLSCQHRTGELRPLHALLEGRGVCTSATTTKVQTLLLPSYLPGNSSDSEEERNASSIENQAIPNTQRVLDSKLHPHHTKLEIIQKEQAKNTQRYKQYEPISTDAQNLSSELKQDTEYGPCRRELDGILNNLKIMNVVSPRGLRIPNCDKKGFYKKKQCRPAKGRKRGFCWCVDKYGQPLPGYDGKGKGDVHCYNLESK
ncbi:insulin-like growth factor-binding protein 3 [Latimeria chalumnae]|uniref:Insulin-like growth factor-binding protein 3 n=1 Tax=Latimeria chalumnae TaxID=7897 RepID=H2ZWT5_LATCH|nr:PREDICTED: insulin-like growth factor-binding protein 3 [Latimeria chalumnae]|eukprot:XP_006013829.1 PREDICTED: insulin-like growth factor-binding protein 3 [Latimeria chalumnae]